MAPINYSMIFDNINLITDKAEMLKELSCATNCDKRFINRLGYLSAEHNGKFVWYIKDLERVLNIQIKEAAPFFRPEFFIGGWDYNSYSENGETIDYVTACGLKKILLIIQLGFTMADIDSGKRWKP